MLIPTKTVRQLNFYPTSDPCKEDYTAFSTSTLGISLALC